MLNPHGTFLVLSAMGFAAVFLAFPGIDIWASNLLYDPTQGFVLKGNAFFDLAKISVEVLLVTLLLGTLLFWLPRKLKLLPAKLAAKRSSATFILLVLLLGPGLMVNLVFKDQWGRARPAQILQFGGERQFTPAWVMSNQCEKNCSFVCGDASVGFVLLAFAFISRNPRRWLAIGLAAGGFYGYMRMGQGGHFLSDVIFSGYTVFFTAWGTHQLMLRGGYLDPPKPA